MFQILINCLELDKNVMYRQTACWIFVDFKLWGEILKYVLSKVNNIRTPAHLSTEYGILLS